MAQSSLGCSGVFRGNDVVCVCIERTLKTSLGSINSQGSVSGASFILLVEETKMPPFLVAKYLLGINLVACTSLYQEFG
jgi:hypothetical protein